MKEFAREISAGPDILRIYYLPMTYRDWLFFSDSSAATDRNALRYLFGKYMTHASLTSGNQTEDIDARGLVDLSVGVVTQAAYAIIEDSGFDDSDMFSRQVTRMSDQSMTLMGVYDTFILIHGGIDLYRQYLDASIYDRTMIVSALQRLTRIDVAERFRYSIDNNLDVDIINSPEKFKQAGKVKSREKERILSSRHAQTRPEEEKGADIRAMLDDATTHLARAMAEGKKNPRKFFDTKADELAFGEFEKS
jgi:hypothetical protein